MTLHDAAVDWLRRQLGTADISLANLPGATTSTLFKVETKVETPGHACVLRVFDTSVWLESVQDLPGREAQILKMLAPSKIPAPRLIATADANSPIGAAVLMSWLPGHVTLPHAPTSEWLATLARGLASIHTAALAPLPWQYESWQRMTGKPAPVWFGDQALWRAVQNAITKKPTAPSTTERCFLHRDYHPVNVLWQGEAISGIVDWVNACMGPRGVDVAHCRLNLVLMYGLATANAFLDAYCEAAGGYQHDRYWDLDAALAWFPEPTSYPPWQEFGLGTIELPLLTERIQDFLAAAAG